MTIAPASSDASDLAEVNGIELAWQSFRPALSLAAVVVGFLDEA